MVVWFGHAWRHGPRFYLLLASEFIFTLVAPLLSVDEVLQAVEGVNWRRLGRELLEAGVGRRRAHGHGPSKLDRICYEHESDAARLRAVVEEFLTKTDSPSWRRVIWALYCADEVDKAQQIRSYPESLQGIYAQVHQIRLSRVRCYENIWLTQTNSHAIKFYCHNIFGYACMWVDGC